MTEADKIQELRDEGFDMDNAFITQEGAVFDMAYAMCPACSGKITKKDWTPHTMASWLCKSCGVRCDEPIFDEPEVAYMAYIGEED